MLTIGQALAEIRGIYKLADQDSTLTDRFLYSLIRTPATALMRRQDSASKLLRFNGIFQPLDFEELVEVDQVAAACLGAPSGCTFRRTKHRLPEGFQGYFGPLLRSVTSLDISQDCQPIYPSMWAKMARQANFRYNYAHYYWYSDGYLFFPNVDWAAVMLEGVFEFNVAHRNYDGNQKDCLPRQQSPLAIPEFLLTEIKQQIRADLGLSAQLPSDPGQDNKHPLS